jgi:hypothetical protein
MELPNFIWNGRYSCRAFKNHVVSYVPDFQPADSQVIRRVLTCRFKNGGGVNGKKARPPTYVLNVPNCFPTTILANHNLDVLHQIQVRYLYPGRYQSIRPPLTRCRWWGRPSARCWGWGGGGGGGGKVFFLFLPEKSLRIRWRRSWRFRITVKGRDSERCVEIHSAWILIGPRSSSFWIPRNLSHHIDSQARTGNTVLDKSREMTGRTQTLPWWLRGEGVKTTEKKHRPRWFRL